MIYKSMRQKKEPARMCSCGGRAAVILVKDMDDGTVYRRRVCKKCGRRWSTLELPAISEAQYAREEANHGIKAK